MSYINLIENDGFLKGFYVSSENLGYIAMFDKPFTEVIGLKDIAKIHYHENYISVFNYGEALISNFWCSNDELLKKFIGFFNRTYIRQSGWVMLKDIRYDFKHSI